MNELLNLTGRDAGFGEFVGGFHQVFVQKSVHSKSVHDLINKIQDRNDYFFRILDKICKMSRLLAVKKLLRNRTVISPYFHNYLTESQILQTQNSKTNETQLTTQPECFNLSHQTYQKSAAIARNHTIKHGADLGLKEETCTEIHSLERSSIQATIANFTKPNYTSKKLFVPVSVLDFCDEAKIKSERFFLLQFSCGTWGQRFVPQSKARKILYHEIGLLAVLDKVSGSLNEVEELNLKKRKEDVKPVSFENPGKKESLENIENPDKVTKQLNKNSIFLVSPKRTTKYTKGVGKKLDKLRGLSYSKKSDMISSDDFFSAVVFSDDFVTKSEKMEIIGENLAKLDPRMGSLFNGKISNLMLQNNQLYLDLSEDKRVLKIYLRDIWEDKNQDLVFQIKIPELRSKILQEADIFSVYIPRILNYLKREHQIDSIDFPKIYLNCNYKLRHKIVSELKTQCTDHNSLFRKSLLNFCPQGMDNRSISRNPLLEIEGVSVSDEYFTPWNNDVLKKWYKNERYDSIKFDIVQHAETTCLDISSHQSCIPTDLRVIEQEFIPRKKVILENGVIEGSLSGIEKQLFKQAGKSVKKEAKREIKIVGYFMHQDAGWSGMMVKRDDRNKQNPLKVTKFGSTLTQLEYLDCIDKNNQQTKLASNLLQLILMLTDVISRSDIPKNTHISTILSEAFLKYIPETDKKSYERDITVYLRNLINFEQISQKETHHRTINPELIVRLRGLLKFKNVTVEFKKGEHIFKHVFHQSFHSHPLRFEEIETSNFRPACKSIQLVLGMWKDRIGLRYFDKDVVFTRIKDLCYGHVFPLEFCSDRNFCLLVLCFYLSELKIEEILNEDEIEQNNVMKKDEVSANNKKPITIYLPNTTPVTRTCSVSTELEKTEKIAFEYLQGFIKTELKANLNIKTYKTEIQSRNIYHPWNDVFKKEWLINDYFCSHSSAKDQTKWVKHLLGPTQQLEIINISEQSISKVLENYQADKEKLLIMRSSDRNIVKREYRKKGEYEFHEMDLGRGWSKDEELRKFLKKKGKGKYILYQNKGVDYYSMGDRNKNHDCKGFAILNRAELLEYVNSYSSAKSRRFFDRARMNQKIEYKKIEYEDELMNEEINHKKSKKASQICKI